MDTRAHWKQIYGEKSPDEVSWFEPTPRSSLELIDEAGIDHDARVIDVGGGASRLAGELLARGYTDITVADISDEALGLARAELGDQAARITWLEVRCPRTRLRPVLRALARPRRLSLHGGAAGP